MVGYSFGYRGLLRNAQDPRHASTAFDARVKSGFSDHVKTRRAMESASAHAHGPDHKAHRISERAFPHRQMHDAMFAPLQCGHRCHARLQHFKYE
jgi:hypothetical protein